MISHDDDSSDENWTEDTHDDNYLNRLGIVIIEPKKPKKKPLYTFEREYRSDFEGTFEPNPQGGHTRRDSHAHRDIRQDGGNVPSLTIPQHPRRSERPELYQNQFNRAMGRGARRSAVLSTDEDYTFGDDFRPSRQRPDPINQDIPVHHRMNIHPELQNYIDELPAQRINLEYQIEHRREVVEENPENHRGAQYMEPERDTRYVQRDVFAVGDRTFQTHTEAANYCRQQRGFDPESNVPRSKEGAEQLLGEAMDICMGFIHSSRGRGTLRDTNPHEIINQVMEVCKERKLIDAFNIGHSMDTFGYTLSVKKWEYHLNYDIDTGMLNF